MPDLQHRYSHHTHVQPQHHVLASRTLEASSTDIPLQSHTQ